MTANRDKRRARTDRRTLRATGFLRRRRMPPECDLDAWGDIVMDGRDADGRDAGEYGEEWRGR